MTAEQLLREPSAERSALRSESPRSLSNEALMASLRPPPDYGNGRALRRSMEPHLVEGLSWFLERSPWQRALLSTGLGALVGVGIVVTLARLFLPELGTATTSAAPAASGLAALAAPAASTLRDPPAPPLQALPQEPASTVQADLAQVDPARASAVLAMPSDTAPAAALASAEPAADTQPAPGKAARKAKAGKRSKKAKQRARKSSSLPARWSELYARER